MEYSIIIPVFNEIKKIERLIDDLKLLNNNYEIIIIDDGSFDGTSNFLSKYQNFNILKNTTNIGKSASIVRGLNNSKGKYIILFDGDLEIRVKEIKKQMSISKKLKI